MSVRNPKQPNPRMFICQVIGDKIFDRLETTKEKAQEDLECLSILEPHRKFELYEEF